MVLRVSRPYLRQQHARLLAERVAGADYLALECLPGHLQKGQLHRLPVLHKLGIFFRHCDEYLKTVEIHHIEQLATLGPASRWTPCRACARERRYSHCS